jgi:hypothetical protein
MRTLHTPAGCSAQTVGMMQHVVDTVAGVSAAYKNLSRKPKPTDQVRFIEISKKGYDMTIRKNLATMGTAIESK